jgi:hypothetical protein
MNDQFAIRLEPTETAILASIEFDAHKLRHETAQTNGSAVVELMRLLVKRRAIPEARARYWADPKYQHSNMKASRKEIFERHGNKGEEIYKNLHFLPYLRYFLYGADLPSKVIAALKAEVGNPDWLTSSDIVPLTKFARTLARQNGLDHEASEEFFKLALDLGLPVDTAGAIRQSVMKIR